MYVEDLGAGRERTAALLLWDIFVDIKRPVCRERDFFCCSLGFAVSLSRLFSQDYLLSYDYRRSRFTMVIGLDFYM